MNLKKFTYLNWVVELKQKIQTAQLKAIISVNKQLLLLYWELGKSIFEKITESNWDSSIVNELSKDLKKEFPSQKGFSRSNLFSMKKWYEFYFNSDIEITKIQQLVGQIPWGHNVMIVFKSKSVDEALFYCSKTIENNWLRSVLTHQINSDFYQRKGKAITNFKETLPTIYSELATETLKDPYKFDFLNIQEQAKERDIENQLIKHITSFLLELGAGFSFVGKQVLIKIEEHKAEFAGKMNLYLSAVDNQYKTESDNPINRIVALSIKNQR